MGELCFCTLFLQARFALRRAKQVDESGQILTKPLNPRVCAQCGGERGAVAAAEPFFHMMGKRVHFCGGPGNGQAAKVPSGAHGNPVNMLRKLQA